MQNSKSFGYRYDYEGEYNNAQYGKYNSFPSAGHSQPPRPEFEQPNNQHAQVNKIAGWSELMRI